MTHRESHYKRESTSLNYFKHSALNLKKLYNLFIDFSQSVIQKDYVAIEQTTYNTHFNRNLHFTFKLPRKDVCNDCYESAVQCLRKSLSTRIWVFKFCVGDFLAISRRLDDFLLDFLFLKARLIKISAQIILSFSKNWS